MSRRSEKRERRAVEQWAADLRWLMNDERGRRVVNNLLARCAFGQNVFTGNSQGNFLQGRQSLANELAQEIKLVAKLLPQFHLMEVEAATTQQIAEQEALPDADEAE